MTTKSKSKFPTLRETFTTGLGVLMLPLVFLLYSTQVLALQDSALKAWATEKQQHILVLGDSISAAYGIEQEQGWVNLFEQQLVESISADAAEESMPTITNASISGDTTDGGLQRLPKALEKFSPDLVIIELGGNDGLRGQSIKRMQQNIEKMAILAQDSGADVMILGMRIPSNYGAAYTTKFFDAFGDAAENTGSALVPFFLEPIAEQRSYFQPDGVHPTADAQPLLLEPVLLKLEEMLSTPNQ